MTNVQKLRGAMVHPSTARVLQSREDAVLSRREIEGLIARGRHILIYEGTVLKVDAWLKFHPGGEKAIQHMVGRDATDEINALHSLEARQRMKSYQIGRIEGQWKNFLPPIQGGIFRLEGIDEMIPDDVDDSHSSAQESSSPPSPLFEAVDRQTLRSRQSSATSISSVASTPPSPGPKAHFEPKPFFLDARTQEEIVLDVAKYPSVNSETQNNIVEKYRQLNQRIQAEGLYNCNYFAYFVEFCRYSLLFSLFVFFLRRGWYATSAFFLGCLWHQLVFTAHDAGHMGITHNFHVDTVIGIIVADYIGGLSLGWWKRNHNVHHIVTNSPEHDPDIEHMPFFAISHRFFSNLRSTYYERIMKYDLFAQFLIRYQHYLYYPILLFGRFNLYRLSWEYLLLRQAPRRGPAWWHLWFEVVGQVFFWAWYGYGVVYLNIPDWRNRLVFILVSHMVQGPLHVQITLSHFAMSTADLGVHESFPQKMLRTTMDVDCPTWLDFFHGGLQFQVIHHLYPRIPRHNLRSAQNLVKDFCKDVDIPYAIFTFYDGNKEVIGRLSDIAKQARIFAECQKSVAQQGIFSDHHHHH
ncbi:linoleoyl-CoA desaturase, putative [Coccidioides posadasii C735 delta SOWgp]|uniref:Delta 8-(E)-sphingolipid desaturase n=2 Tax=Coccidioides posadasii TaxID=199306 RepID=A0A0J6FNC3_COCPO|nr:linoleoyl-CoA desaturase, putative [Coccidioides posadasii C735 delta SOWgp]EER25550.1 linoleoyl-CoA desaturase, putative [Coccidioides posadasii C735 delta SOWgp]KMM70940.1 delta-6 fatty acid desaturase [Coccidioides posadasii RMSCC 3488]|eukprot:XP_003067695.1 linoleoyl-CoA desaturase, putative [Coccidioides posadasii C735 delta SOWgp]